MNAQLTLTPDPLAIATCWRRKNPVAYEQIVRWSYEDASMGYRPSIALYVELLRRPHFAYRLGLRRMDSKFLIRNALRADLARLIMREEPALKFATREAYSDSWRTP